MSEFYKKVVVIGAGTMGSGIAAHLANSKIQTILLDLSSDNIKNLQNNLRNKDPQNP